MSFNSPPVPISAIILTFNEELNLEKCLQSLTGFCDEIIIVDSFSTDKTKEIALNYNVQFIENVFKKHTQQWNFALKEIPVKNNWVLGLDADQCVSVELAQELRILFQSGKQNNYSGIYIRKKSYFLGKRIRYGGVGEISTLKIFKKDDVYLDEGELVDHHFYVTGESLYLKGWIIDNNAKDTLSFWYNKAMNYAYFQVDELLQETVSLPTFTLKKIISDRQHRILFLKFKLWAKTPILIRPFIYFFYRYFILLGFLDGRIGLVYHVLHGFVYHFYQSCLIYEMQIAAKSKGK